MSSSPGVMSAVVMTGGPRRLLRNSPARSGRHWPISRVTNRLNQDRPAGLCQEFWGGGHLQWRSDLDACFEFRQYLGAENKEIRTSLIYFSMANILKRKSYYCGLFFDAGDKVRPHLYRPTALNQFSPTEIFGGTTPIRMWMNKMRNKDQ